MRQGQTRPQCNDHAWTTQLAGMGPFCKSHICLQTFGTRPQSGAIPVLKLHGPEDAMQIDLLPNLPPSWGYENVPNCNWCLRSISVRLSSYGRFSNQYSKSAHSYNDETCVFTNNTHYWQRNCIHFYDYCGDYANFGNHTHMCNNSTSANNREIGTNTCFTEDESKNGMWGKSPTMA